MNFIKKNCVCDEDVVRPDEIITYWSLVQQYMREYRNIVDSERWEPTGSKKKFQDEPLLLKYFTVTIEDSVNKTVKKVYCKIRHNGKDDNSVSGLSTNSVVACHKFGKKGYIKKNFKSNVNTYGG